MKKKLLFIIVILSFSNAFGQQQEILNTLKETIDKDASKTIILGDSILTYVDLSKKEKAKVKYYQALAYQNNKNHKKALKYFERVMPFLEKENDKTTYIAALLSQSNSNVYLNNYTIATTQALKARELAKKNNLTELIASANTALSFIYYATDDYFSALEYLASSEKIFISENKGRELSAVYNNIAILHKKMGTFEKAIDYNKKSLQISIKNKHYLGIGKSYSNIGRIYAFLDKPDNALAYYDKAITINLKHNISNSTPFSNKAETFRLLNNYKKAEENLLKALKIELLNDNDFETKKIYNDLLELAIMTKSYEKAYNYQQKIAKINKTISRHSNEEKIKMIENQHQLTQKQQELINAEQKSKNQLIFFSTFTMLLIFLSLFLIQRNKTEKLKEDKEKMILEQRVLRSQMNPHFIFNALSAIQNSLLDNEPIKSATYLSRFAKLIRQNFDFINEKNILLVEEIDALKNYLDTQKMRFQDKFDYEINIFANVDINSVNIPPLLLQPFVENAIEHGFKNKKEQGKITINIFKKEQSYCYEIIDNGNGINPKKTNSKIHAIDIFKKRLKLRDKNDEKSFKITSTEKGTTIKFCLKT
jgi:tetratricopeptide (TPR) repeat protein